MVIDFVVDPDNEFKKAIQKASEEVEDLTIPFTLMEQSWFKSNRAIFSLKGPGKYSDLSEVYKPRKKKDVGFIYPILRRLGALESSLTVPGDEDSVATILNKKTLVLGTKTPYAGFLHGGTSRMPARPMVLVGAEQVAPDEINRRRLAWIEILGDYVLQKAKQVGTVSS